MISTSIMFYMVSLTQPCVGRTDEELRILFNIIHEDCNKLVIVTITKS